MEYLSLSYCSGFIVLLCGVLLPLLYMAFQNKSSFRFASRRE